MGALIALKPQQIELIRRTVASDCNDSEFDLFMEAAKSYGLDPFRKQVIPLVFSKGNAEKRRMSIVVSRDGLRVIAQRCADYRPASEKAEIEYDENLKGPTNPKGIVSATVRLWKQDKRGDWFPVVGEAYWDEFAPVADEWAYSQEEGKRRPTGNKVLDASGNWARMPIVMITKCAESQALRAGWPDQFGGLYAEEEMDQALAKDMTASQIVEHEAQDRRMRLAGAKDAITFSFDGTKLENVPLGRIADKCAEFIGESDPEQAYQWSLRNAEPLREFWARAPADALEVKKLLEPKIREFERHAKGGSNAA